METRYTTIPFLFIFALLFILPVVNSASLPSAYDVFNYGDDRAFVYVITNDSIRNYDYNTFEENWRINQTILYDDPIYPTPLYEGWFYLSSSSIYDPNGDATSITGIGSQTALFNDDWNTFYYAPASIIRGSGDDHLARFTGSSLTDIGDDPFSNANDFFFYDTWDGELINIRDASGSTNVINVYDQSLNLDRSLTLDNGVDATFSHTAETSRALGDTTTDRIYVGVGLSGGSSNADNWLKSRFYSNFNKIIVLDDDLDNVYNITLPSGHVGHDMTVWNENRNRLVVVGSEDFTYGANNWTSFVNIYDSDDGTFVGGYSRIFSTQTNDTSYVDVAELPSGDLLLAQYIDSDTDELHVLPVFGDLSEYDLDTNLPISRSSTPTLSDWTRNLISLYDANEHSTYYYTNTPVPFDSIPEDVYEHFIGAYDDIPDYLTWDSYSLVDKTVEVTLSDVSLDNFEVPFIINDGYADSNIEYSALNYLPVQLGNWTVTNLNGGDNQTVTYPIGNNSLAYDFFEFVWNVNFTNTTTDPENAIAWIDFRTTDTTLSGSTWDNDSTFSIGVGYPFDGISTGYPNNDSVSVYYRSSATVGESTQLNELMREVSTGGDVVSITLRSFFDRNGDSPRIAFRLEVERDGASDTVTLSDWLYSVPIFTNSVTITDNSELLASVIDALYCTQGNNYVLAGAVQTISASATEYCYETTTNGITVRTLQPEYGSLYLNGSNTQIDSDWSVYVYQQPIFGNGDDSNDVNGAEVLTARIYDNGESTLRLYASSGQSVPNDYDDWSYTVNLDNAVIVGVVDDDPFTSGTSTTGGSVGTGDAVDPTETQAASALPTLGSLTQSQSNFVYTVVVLLLIWVVMIGYGLYLSSLTGDKWIVSVSAGIGFIASVLWIIGAAFIGWLPVWVIVLMILIGGGVVVSMFRGVFMGGE